MNALNVVWAAMVRLSTLLLVLVWGVTFGPIAAVGWVFQRTGKQMLMVGLWGLTRTTEMVVWIRGG